MEVAPVSGCLWSVLGGLGSPAAAFLNLWWPTGPRAVRQRTSCPAGKRVSDCSASNMLDV